ncbi:MAG: YicC family protein [Pyrinomonadaceae bacterium]|nr:YicC family protein [Pyrinomonadaceae bacterium]MCX7640034.1 YicC family protein [Pyrinomonadaceae bacterium]MDW8304206.1 YicC/YloC family endoribonuclease [Acidobacteriota bacterium]
MRSMTGFGRGSFADKNYHVFVEIKSVNNRFLNIVLKMPQEINSLEAEIRKTVAKKLMRGSVEISINYKKNKPTIFEINHSLIEGFLSVMSKIKEEYKIDGTMDLNTIARLPYAILPANEEIDEQFRLAVFQTLDQALKQLEKMQKQEGKATEEVISKSLDKIELLAQRIDEIKKEALKDHFQYLSKRISELVSVELDEARLFQEIAYIAEKSDISEENERLKSHILQMRSIISSEDRNIGKKLDFLAQELNREANTILSKTTNINIKQLALDIKNETEKIREQVQNVE